MENELNQEGDAKEQPKEEISEDVSQAPSTEEKETSEKQKREEEWKSMMQSRTDKAEARAQKLEANLQQLQQREEQRLSEERRKEIEALAEDPDGQARARYRHKLEDDIRAKEKQNEELAQKMWNKYDQSIALADKYDLSPADARALMDADTPKEMELQAQLKVAEKAKGSAPPKETKEGFPKPDSGTSDAGSDDDKSFQERWNRGDPSTPPTKENIARIEKILNKTK
jgi:hypothetical protein